MLELDYNEGVRMWEYLLKRYVNCKDYVDFSQITDDIVESGDYNILKKVFSDNETIRTYVFKLNPYKNHYQCYWFIRDLILNNELQLAETLISLYLENNNGDNDVQNNLYELLHYVISSDELKWKWTNSSEGIDFITKLIPKVTDKVKRSELEVCLVDLIDCVENDAPKGSIPFSLLMSEGGLEMFLEEKQKQMKVSNNNPIIKDTFNDFMNEQKEKRETITEISDMQNKSEKLFDMEALAECQKEIDVLIGLDSVKNEITNLTNFIRIIQLRIERGIDTPNISQHLVFTGNPGTGKTTIARLIGKIYKALGYLSKGHFVEVDRSELVAGYIGQTAIKTQEVIKKAIGGILFIDEAYSLYVDKTENDFGREAIETLLKAMEDYRNDFVVIVAGYQKQMQQFIKSNPGLKSRFNKYVHFPDYTGNELYNIFNLIAEKNQYIISKDLNIVLKKYFQDLYDNRDEDFGNGRDVRNFFEKLIEAQAGRIVSINSPSDKELLTITLDDFNRATAL